MEKKTEAQNTKTAKTEVPKAKTPKTEAQKTKVATPKAPKAEAPKYFSYDGKPMVRRGDVIYYGDPKEKYIVIFTINSKKAVDDMEIADSVTIELSTNNGNGKEKIIRKAKRESLYSAFDVGEFWLRDTLENTQA